MDEKIRVAIEAIEKRLAEKAMNRFYNARVREGYEEALEVLKSGKTDYADIKCESDQSRCIVALVMDYMKGECDLEVITNVPIRKRK
ncbi:MAG: hypothetical protein M0R37_12340 [Bacteroidales bacterium]|nr:hypothetical protein [Bacteroidales bacterium]